MSYQTGTYYCTRCKAGTAHEQDAQGKGHCIVCTAKQARNDMHQQMQSQSDTNRHIAALDGFGNHGENQKAAARRRKQR